MMLGFILLYTSLTVALPEKASALGETLFSDDFSTNLNQWSNTSGAYLQNANLVSSNNESLETSSGGTAWTDYRLEADINAYDVAVGVVFRKQNDDNLYMWQFNAASNKFRPHKKVNGSWTVLKEVPLASNQNVYRTWQHIKIEVTGNTIQTWIGDTLIDTTTDSTFTNGKIGFRQAYGETAVIDNVTVVNLASGGTVQAGQFYVDPVNGDDNNNGAIGSPFRSIAKARDAVRSIKTSVNGDVVVYLRGGTHRLTSAVTFTSLDSGVNGHNIVYKAYPGETPVLSGGELVTGWTNIGANWYTAHVDPSKKFRQLYVNGSHATLARFPNEGSYKRMADWDNGSSTSLLRLKISDTELPAFNSSTNTYWTNDPGNPVNINALLIWTNWKARLDYAVQRTGGFTYFTPLDPERTMMANKSDPPKRANQSFFLENAYEFLDAPGEWYMKYATGDLFYLAKPGENMATAQVVVPRTDTLIKVTGASNIRFEGITFQDTTWTGPMQYGFIDHQAGQWSSSWTSYNSYVAPRTPAAVTLETASNVQIVGSKFHNIGSVAIDIYKGSQSNIVEGNQISDIAGNGIQEGYFPTSNVDPYYNPSVSQQDRNNRIVNNYITRVGRDYAGSVGIVSGYTKGVVIEHNEINDVPYSGISVGWGWSFTNSMLGNNSIRYNHISNFLKSVTDGGGVYVLSRQPGTVIDSNWIHGANKNSFAEESNLVAIYLDAGSSNITVSNTVWSDTDWGLINCTPDKDNSIDEFEGTQIENGQSIQRDNIFNNNGSKEDVQRGVAPSIGYTNNASSIMSSAGLESAWTYIRP